MRRLKGLLYLQLTIASKINLQQSSHDLEGGYSKMYVLLLKRL